MLFQGEEFAASTPFQYFADHEDPAMAKAVSEGRRREFAAFGWKAEEIPDPEKMETFERSKLNWDEVHQGDHAAMLEWTKSLIHLRRASVSLNDGDTNHVKVEFDEQKRWLTMRRGAVLAACNLGSEAVELENAEELPLRLASQPGIEVTGKRIRLPPDSFALLSEEVA
jgi:maltooligosyltrehalose trehalohydrolase